MILKDYLTPNETEKISKMLEFEEIYSISDIKDRLRTRQAQCFSDGDSIAITSVSNYPKKRILNLWMVTGNLGTIFNGENFLFEWARERGCQEVQLMGRKGWKKILPDWDEMAVKYCLFMLVY